MLVEESERETAEGADIREVSQLMEVDIGEEMQEVDPDWSAGNQGERGMGTDRERQGQRARGRGRRGQTRGRSRSIRRGRRGRGGRITGGTAPPTPQLHPADRERG